MPKFSVVIPTYNRSAALKATLETVLAQSCANFEVIVVDDGSTDETPLVVEGMKDSRIRYVWIQNSGGPATPRNIGMSMAEGEWISFLDSDDLWFPDKLLALEQSILEDPELDAICHDEKVRHHSGRENILHYGPTTPDFYRTLLIEGNRCSTSAMTVRRTFIELHAVQFNTDRDYVIVEDYDFWMRLAHHGARFRFLKAVLGEYVLGEGGISRNLERARHNWLRVLEDHVFRIQQFEPDREKLWRYLRARVYATNAISDLRLRRFVSFCRHMFSAVCLSPASVMDWTGARLRRKLRVID